MNAHTLSRRDRPGWSGPRRALAPAAFAPAALAPAALAAAALAAAAILVAACGGSGPSGATGSTQYQKALAFTRCMRSHGALGFPDPTSQGTITVTQAMLNNPQIRAAAPGCRRLMPRGAVQLPAGLQRKLETQALHYSACMRSHGVPNFPDPTIHDGTIGFHVAVRSGGPGPKASGAAGQNAGGSPGPNPGGAPVMPQFQAAQRACQNLLPGR